MTEEMVCHNCDSSTIVLRHAHNHSTVRCGGCGTLLAMRRNSDNHWNVTQPSHEGGPWSELNSANNNSGPNL